jgi:hypothetical protein
MLLRDKNGIRCDLCGTTVRTKFTYYSIETIQAVVRNAVSVGSQPFQFNHDVCESCYTTMVDQCKKNLAARIIPKQIKCDFCPKHYGGTFSYYSLRLSKVAVDVELDPPLKVERNIMDFNVADCCFKDLLNKVNNVVDKVKHEGEWS